jgi:hypothetical protein
MLPKTTLALEKPIRDQRRIFIDAPRLASFDITRAAPRSGSMAIGLYGCRAGS